MEFFQRKFAVALVIKIYSNMGELSTHPDYAYLYINSINFQIKQIPDTNRHFLLRVTTFKPAVMRVKISEKITSIFPVLDLLITGKQLEKKILYCK